MEVTRRRAIQATSELLTSILGSNPTYVRQWRRAGQRFRSDQISPAAAAQVLAEYLWEIGEVSDEAEPDLPRKLRDRMRRALRGEQLTGQTLGWLIGAFQMSDEDDERLWAAFAGDAVGPQDGIRDTVTLPRPLGKRQWHRTRTLFEKYYFAGDGSYEHRHTLQVIEAIEDGVDSYLFNHEPYADRISVAYGGTVGKHYEYGNGLVSDEIMLGRTLQTGQRIPVEYDTHFEAGIHHPSEVRRAVRARVLNLDFAIHFQPARQPKTIMFCAWPDHYDGDPVLTENLVLDEDGAAHRFISFAEQTVLGFKWAW